MVPPEYSQCRYAATPVLDMFTREAPVKDKEKISENLKIRISSFRYPRLRHKLKAIEKDCFQVKFD